MSYHPPPPHVQGILRTLREAGHTVYIVGGAVRDQTLGVEPKDYDLVTDAKPEEISRLFAKTLDIGKQFGISMVVQDGHTTEIATFRSDGDYEDARHPKAVVFATPEVDARRRDFTINGLFWDPEEDEILDYVDGLKDLANRMIRTIGNPEKRFQEDALRILRAIRFEAQLAPFKFQIEKETLQAIAKLCPTLVQVSRERITQEINLIFASPQPSVGFHHLLDLGLWYQWTGLSGEILGEGAMDSIHEDAHPLTYWALGLYGITEEKKLAQALTKFVLPREWQDRIKAVLLDKGSLLAARDASLAELKHFLQEDSVLDFFYLYGAFGTAYPQNPVLAELAGAAAFCAKKRAEFQDAGTLNPAPLLTGKDLLGLGLAPGPQLKIILDKVRDAQLNELIATKDEAVALAKKA